MSEIHKKIDPKAAQMMAAADDRDGSTLMAPLRLEEDLDEVMLFMTGSIRVDGIEVPRFGLLSLLLQKTPVYVYGHPAFKKVSKTAFTDGIHVFLCDDFYDKLLEDITKNKNEFGVEWVLLHELMHKLYEHCSRLREFPPDISNRATDLNINANLRLGYPEVKPCATLRETALSYRAGEEEKYAKMSEESIARELMNDRLEKERKQKQQCDNGQGKPQKQGQGGQGKQQGQASGGQQQGQGQGQQQSQGGGQGQGQNQGQGGQQQGGQGGQPGGQQPGGPGGQQQGQGGKGQQQGEGGGQGEEEPSDQFGSDGDNHMVDLRDFIEMLEEEGLDKIKDSLNLPDSTDVEKIGQFENEQRQRTDEAIMQAEDQMNRVGGKYPGAHIAEAAASYVRARAKGKLNWKLGLRDLIFGDGMRHHASMEEPSDLRYVPDIEDVLGFEPYLPVELPHKTDEIVVVVVDTSGSVSDEDLSAFVAEILELKQASSGGEAASEVIVLSADTVLRGEPIEITENNVDEFVNRGVKFSGRGGTDLEESMVQTLQLELIKEKRCRAFVYFTDTYDRGPSLERLEAAGLLPTATVAYVVAPSTSKDQPAQVENFRSQVNDYAKVYEIRDGNEVNLESDERSEAKAGRRRRNKM